MNIWDKRLQAVIIIWRFMNSIVKIEVLLFSYFSVLKKSVDHNPVLASTVLELVLSKLT